jgi:hypothetical protein
MRVPRDYAIVGSEGPPTGEYSDPQDHGDECPQSRAEKKRPEAVTQQWYRLRPKPRNAATRLGTANRVLVHDHEIGFTSPNVKLQRPQSRRFNSTVIDMNLRGLDKVAR